MGQVVRIPAKPMGRPPAGSERPKRGGKRQPEALRERKQRTRDLGRGSKEVELRNDDALLPDDPPVELAMDAEWAYRRIVQQQREWHERPGYKAFVKASDVDNVLRYCRLHQAYEDAKRKRMDCEAMMEPLAEQSRLLMAEVKLLLDCDKAHRQLGYVPGQYNHVDTGEQDEPDEDLFGD